MILGFILEALKRLGPFGLNGFGCSWVLLGCSWGASGKHLGVLLGSSWVFVGAPGVLPGIAPAGESSWGTPGELPGVCGCIWYSWDRMLLCVPGASGVFWMVLECSRVALQFRAVPVNARSMCKLSKP